MPNTVAESLLINPQSIVEDHIHVVAAIIWKQANRKQFLIAQRQKGKHLENYWELPGGKVEAGETTRQALQRELNEEINIRALDAEQFMQVFYRYPDRNVLLDTWVVGAYDGEVQAREHQAVLWIAIDEIESYRFPPADKPILDALKSL